MKELFEYLAQFHVDHHGTPWISALQVVNETGTSKEELQEIIQEIKIEAFLDCMIANVPCAEGLHSLTITQRRRLSLKAGITPTLFVDEIRSTTYSDSQRVFRE